jgi:hypothetical protein
MAMSIKTINAWAVERSRQKHERGRISRSRWVRKNTPLNARRHQSRPVAVALSGNRLEGNLRIRNVGNAAGAAGISIVRSNLNGSDG